MLQMIVSGVALGAIYGLIALGIVMVFKATGILNFAHGEAAMLSAFTACTLVRLGLPMWAVVPLVLLFGAALGMLIERFIIRRFIGKALLSSAICTLGLFLIFGDLAIWLWGKDTQELPSVFPAAPNSSTIGTTAHIGRPRRTSVQAVKADSIAASPCAKLRMPVALNTITMPRAISP